MYTTSNSNAARDTNDLKQAGNNVAKAARDTVNDLGDAAREAGRNVRGFLNTATTEVNHAAGVVTQQIEDRPIPSVMVALALGFLIGNLWRR